MSMSSVSLKLNEDSSGKAAAVKAFLALFSAAAAAASYLFPSISCVFEKVHYNISALSVLTTSLLVKDTIVAFPLNAKIFAAAFPVLIIAGVLLLIFRKHVFSASAFALAALMPLFLMLGVTSIDKSIQALDVYQISFSLSYGWWIGIISCVSAAVFALWSDSEETLAHSLFLISACISIGSVAFITIYMFAQGLPAILEIGLKNFLLGTEWKPDARDGGKFGILYMILASFAGTAGSILIGVPVGILTAVFLAELAPEWMARLVRPAVELLAGIPSVIYGFFGMIIIVPAIRSVFADYETSGDSLLAVIIILSIMILPTIVNVTETSLRTVPPNYKEASLALGATHIETIFKVLIPGAKSGILSGVILGVGRAIGETMAITMVAGNAVRFPSLLGSTRPMTVGIVFEMGYSTGLHRQALFGIGLVLFVFIMLVNISFTIVSKQVVTLNDK